MKNILYIYQNYRKVYSSASLSILRALKSQKECNVDSFEIRPISYNHQYNRVFNRIPFIPQFHFRNENRRLLKQVNSFKYDLIFVMKGTDLKASTLSAIKKENPKLKLACFNPDDPFNLASSNYDIVSSIKDYDFYCIWTRLLTQKLKDAGAKRIIYFPFGIDNKIIYPVKSNYKYDLTFIGNGDEERHNLIRALGNELLNRSLPIKVHVFGSNWPSFSDNVIVHGQRNGEELLKTIVSSKVNLNLLRRQNKNSINMRTFELPSSNGFMLHEYSEEAIEFFAPELEAVYFKSVAELVEKAVFFLENESKREEIRANSFNKAVTGIFSYKNHVRNFLNETEII